MWNDTAPGYKALCYSGYNTITDLITMTKEEIEELKEDGVKPIPRKDKSSFFILSFIMMINANREQIQHSLLTTGWT